MAQGGEDEAPSFTMFLKSPTWFYPISRYLGHALYYYRYDIDFISSDEQEGRKLILFEQYFDLVCCLLSRYCKEYNIKPSKVFMEIFKYLDEPKSEAVTVHSFNFMLATFNVHHFAYMIMSYCNLFKMKCLEDVKEEVKQMRVDDFQKEKWQELWIYLHEEMVAITKRQKRSEEFFSSHTTAMLKGMKYGPFLYTYGTKLCDKGSSYYSDLTQLLHSIKDIKRRKEDVTRYDLATLHKTTQLEEQCQQSTPLPPSSGGILHELNKLKADGLEILKQTLVQSPASKALVTMPNRLAAMTSSDIMPPSHYTAPSSPVQPVTQEPEECATSNQETRSKSSKPQFVTAPSSPSLSTVVTSKALSESPQELKDALLQLQIEGPPFPKLAAASSFDNLTVPDNDSDRKEFLLHAYDRRVVKQLAFMSSVFELQRTVGVKEGLKDLILNQRWFERKWPSPQSKIKPGDKMKDDEDSIYGTAHANERKESKISPQSKIKPGDKMKDDEDSIYGTAHANERK